MNPRRRAFILPLVVLLCFLMISIAFVLQNQSRQQLRFAIQRVRGEQARAAADAGLTAALQTLASNADYTGQAQPTLLGEGPESYILQVLRSPTAMPDGQALPADCIYVWSTGQSSQSVVQAGALVKVGVSGNKGLPGAYGDSIKLSNASRLDSYDSRKGGYKVVNQNATMVTNSESAGSVDLNGGSRVLGSIAVGPKGILGSGTNNENNGRGDGDDDDHGNGDSASTIWSDKAGSYLSSSLQAKAKVLPPVVLPSKPGATDMKISKAATLPPGNYDQVSVSGSANLVLQPGVYVFRQLTMTGAASITLASSDQPVIIYISELCDLNNGIDVSAPTVSPKLLQLNLADGSSFLQSGGSTFTGIVYGPGATINMSNSADVYGTVVGSKLTLNGSAAVHYDEALAEFALDGSGSAGGVAGVQVLSRQRW